MKSSFSYHTPAVHLITEQEQWEKLVKLLAKKPVIAVDLESNGYHCYPERICLVQLAVYQQIYLIDTLAVTNLSGLKNLLENQAILKIFHSCDNDIRALQRDYNIRVKNILDTSIAAKFIGATHLGLSNVLHNFLNVDLKKSKKIQKQDWSKRPLDIESLDYAAADVAYLMALKSKLERLLIALGRLTWFQEECKLLEKIIYKPPGPIDELFWNVKGVSALTAKQRSILKELCIFRDEFAREINQPPFRIITDTALLELINYPGKPLDKIRGLRSVIKYRKTGLLRNAIRQGRQQSGTSISDQPLKNKARGTKGNKNLLKLLKQWREKEALKLKVDPAIIWPMSSLETLSSSLEFIKQLSAMKEIRKWQKKNFKKSLIAMINQAIKLPRSSLYLKISG